CLPLSILIPAVSFLHCLFRYLIILLGSLDDLDESPSFFLAQRPGFHDDHGIPYTTLVFLIVRGKFFGLFDELTVNRVLYLSLDNHRDGLIHLVTADNTGFRLPEISFFHFI